MTWDVIFKLMYVTYFPECRHVTFHLEARSARWCLGECHKILGAIRLETSDNCITKTTMLEIFNVCNVFGADAMLVFG